MQTQIWMGRALTAQTGRLRRVPPQRGAGGPQGVPGSDAAWRAMRPRPEPRLRPVQATCPAASGCAAAPPAAVACCQARWHPCPSWSLKGSAMQHRASLSKITAFLAHCSEGYAAAPSTCSCLLSESWPSWYWKGSAVQRTSVYTGPCTLPRAALRDFQQPLPAAAACCWACPPLSCLFQSWGRTPHPPQMCLCMLRFTMQPVMKSCCSSHRHTAFLLQAAAGRLDFWLTCAMNPFPCGSSMPATSSAAACRMALLSSTSSLYSSRACRGQHLT